jgi:hypothetical protein
VVAAGYHTPFQVVAVVIAGMKQTLASWTILEGVIGILGFLLAALLYVLAGAAGF